MSRAILRGLLLAAAASLTACKSVEIPKLPGVTPYRMVIQQGNFISPEMVAQLKPGMTREQVRFILGTPLVTDIFHADRWDYVFFRELPNGKREQRSLSVVFEGGKLARVIGDLLPADAAEAKPAAKPAAEAKPAAKPEAQQAKPAAAPKPAAEAPKPSVEPPTGQSWRAGSDEPPAKPEAAPSKPEETQAAEEKQERGFFGRLLDRITPAKASEPKTEVQPAAEVVPEAKPAAEAPKPEPQRDEAKPAEEKERGFFGRMLEKIGL